MLTFMFISILSISKVYAEVFNYTLLGKIIYLDPGHGGRDSGTTYKNIYEKDINLIMSKKIEKYLIAKGATVYLTRETDTDLSNSTKNKKRSDLFQKKNGRAFKYFIIIKMKKMNLVLQV